MMKDLSSTQMALLIWSILFLIAAEAVKFLPLSGRAIKLVGLLELLIGIATGVGIGLSASFRKA